jgi:hypothetical protein
MPLKIPPKYQEAVEILPAVKAHCLFCGWSWWPDQTKAEHGVFPKVCPKCARANWERGHINPAHAEKMRRWHANHQGEHQRIMQAWHERQGQTGFQPGPGQTGFHPEPEGADAG